MGRTGSIFRYADGLDMFLMLFGTLGCIGDGMMTPVTMLLLSGLINDYGTSVSAPNNETVDKVIFIDEFHFGRVSPVVQVACTAFIYPSICAS